MKIVQQSGGQTAMIRGRTVRLASLGGKLLKPGTAITWPGGQPQIVTVVKTGQGMQVATMPKGQVRADRHNTLSDYIIHPVS